MAARSATLMGSTATGCKAAVHTAAFLVSGPPLVTASHPPHDLGWAELDWTAEGAPRSQRFDDIYFSRDGGLDEARAEFETYARELRRAKDQEEFDRFMAKRGRTTPAPRDASGDVIDG